MSLIYAIRLFISPGATWSALHERRYAALQVFLSHTVPFAILPVVAGYYGTTRVGWQFGAGEVNVLTPQSALQIAAAYYVVMLGAVVTVAWTIRWMSRTYGADQTMGQCMTLASYTATPLFVVGLMNAYPVLWIVFLAGLPALAYTAYIFYTGVPIIMEISAERGFLFASAVLTFGLVALVAMLAFTVLLWGAGFAPALAG